MADNVTVPNFSQYNFAIGDTVEVVTKQNGMNAALAQFGTSLNYMIDSFNVDVEFVGLARNELDADQIVHAPGSGLPNEAGALAMLSVLSDADVGDAESLRYDLGLTNAATRPVQSSPLDRASDMLLAVGAGGLLVNQGDSNSLPGGAGINDANKAPPVTHFFPVTSSTLNSPGNGQILKFQRGTSLFADFWISAGSALPRVRVRTGTSIPEASEWVSLLMERDIDHGSNSNGRYVRFPSGVMICWSSTASGTRDFPASFSSPPIVVQNHYGGGTRVPVVHNITNDQVTLRLFSSDGDETTGNSNSVRYIAIGQY